MCINTIIRQVNCISCLIKEFSDFARMPSPVMEDNDLINLLKEVIFLQSNSNPNIEFKSIFCEEQLICKFDVTQMNQVFINIIQNAINSISEYTANLNSQNNINNNIGKILVTCSLKKDVIIITIEDDGPGFSESALKKAFEPYFTTRKNGTGLGLAIVYKIINEHGGDIIIGNSSTLHGAKITISIPYIA